MVVRNIMNVIRVGGIKRISIEITGVIIPRGKHFPGFAGSNGRGWLTAEDWLMEPLRYQQRKRGRFVVLYGCCCATL